MAAATKILALLAWCAAAALGFTYAAGAWPPPDPGDIRFIGFHEPQTQDGRRIDWSRSYSKIVVPDPGWRPLRLSLDLRAPGDSAVVEIGLLDSVRGRATVGSGWQTEQIFIRDLPTGPRIELQIWSTVQKDTGYGVGIGAVRQRAVIVSRRGVALLGAAAAIGFLGWVITSRPRRHAARTIGRQAAHSIPGLLPGIAAIIVGFVPILWLGLAGRNVWWVWVTFLALAASGRLLRLVVVRAGASAFPLWRDPVFEMAIGLCTSVAALYVVSFAVKRMARYVDPLEGLFPMVLASTLLAAWLVLSRRRTTPSAEKAAWSSRDAWRLATFFLVVAWIAGPHLTAIHAYSSDPLQHIGWTNQIRLHGFVPDNYADTALLISYPMGFASFAYVMTALTPLAPGNGVNILPVLASALFLYTLVFGIRALQDGPVASRPLWREAVDFLLFGAIAAVFNSAQFGMWHYFEGTGRSSASLVHLIPVAVLIEGLWRLQFRAQAGERAANGSGTRVAMLLLSAILVLLINPGQLLVHGVASLTAAIVVTIGLLKDREALGRAVASVVAAALAGLAILLADPYWYRALARGAGRNVADAHIQKIDADFLQRFREPACLTSSCVRDAIGRVNKLGSLVQPFATAATAPVILARGRVTGAAGETAVDVAFSFPPPVHGMGVLLQGAAVIAFLLLAFRHRWSYVALIVVLLTGAGIDLVVRHVLGQLIGPGDPTLRLLPPYATRAASVFFNQTIWAGLVAGVSFALIRSTLASRRWAPLLVVWAGIVGFVCFTAAADLRAESDRVRPTPAVPTLDDLWDFWEIEREVPRGESYLVTARVLFGNNERYVDPIDEAVTLYAQADRPALFQFFQSYGAQYSASDYLNVCAALKEGVRYPSPIARSRARWVVMLSSSLLDPPIRQKWFCEEAVVALFPKYESIARRGRLTLYRLW